MSANAAQADADQPRPGRIGPREAAQLAAGARVAGVTRGSARVVLELLLRHTRGPIAVERRMRWIAGNLGISHRTTIRAIHDLVTAELIVVAIPGGGRTISAYLVNVDLLRILTVDSPEVTPMTLAVHPGESADPAVTAGVSKRHPRGDRLSPQGCQNVTAGVTDCHPPTRVYARAPGSLLPSHSKDSPTPESPPAPPGTATSPAGGGAPFDQTGDVDQPCRHGRTVWQGGCRACGTSPRQLASRDERATRLSVLEQQRLDRADRRTQEAELQAAAKPPPADLRANIRAARAKP